MNYFKCSCLSYIKADIKETKSGVRYIECPICMTRTALETSKDWGYTGEGSIKLMRELEE